MKNLTEEIEKIRSIYKNEATKEMLLSLGIKFISDLEKMKAN